MAPLCPSARNAILALSCLATCDDVWHHGEMLAACSGVPQPFLAKILLALRKQGLIKAKRGYRGGYRLGRAPEQITIAQIVAVFESRSVGAGCLLGFTVCTNEEACPFRDPCRESRTRWQTVLDQTTLADAARFLLEPATGRFCNYYTHHDPGPRTRPTDGRRHRSEAGAIACEGSAEADETSPRCYEC